MFTILIELFSFIFFVLVDLGTPGPSLTLSAGSLAKDVTYQLRLTLNNVIGYAESVAVFNLKTNRPPDNGKCTVDPMKGTTGTTFDFSCFDWQDLDGILKYVVVFEVKGKQLIICETGK